MPSVLQLVLQSGCKFSNQRDHQLGLESILPHVADVVLLPPSLISTIMPAAGL